MTTPTPGGIVTLRGLYARSNGADECPAMITRVWGEVDGEQGPEGWSINATAFPDAKMPQPATSVRLCVDRAAADAYVAAMAARGVANPADISVAHWPDRV
jgi:hypothetical protein